MVSLILISFAILIITFVIYGRKYFTKPHHNYKELPSKQGWPILGCVPEMKGPECLYFQKLTKEYGNIYSIKFGMRTLVVLNNFDLCKRAFQMDVFSGRWRSEFDKIMQNYSGILNVDGKLWSNHRSFALRVLKDFGFNKSESLKYVSDETQNLLNRIDLGSGNNKLIDFSEIIPYHTLNMISRFVMNTDLNANNLFNKIEIIMTQIARSTDFINFFFLMFPYFDKNKLLASFLLKLTKRKKLYYDFFHLIDDEIQRHQENLADKSECEDYVDKYLENESNLCKNYDSKLKEFKSNNQLILMVAELFAAGYDTTSTLLGWACFFSAYYPKYQEKMFQEIKDIIGLERQVVMTDKKYLQFTQAFLDEVMRMGAIVPLALFHRTMENVVFDGYFIPKDTIVVSNLYSCLRDEKIWLSDGVNGTNSFNPDNFLTYLDNGDLKYRFREEMNIFGIGKRQCLGESLARLEYFIFLTNIIQNYEISLGEPVNNSDLDRILTGNKGIIRFCSYSKFRFNKRSR